MKIKVKKRLGSFFYEALCWSKIYTGIFMRQLNENWEVMSHDQSSVLYELPLEYSFATSRLCIYADDTLKSVPTKPFKYFMKNYQSSLFT
jgi:ribosome-associated toxin RatA of RatAB toxin-antitoxin module